MKDIKEILQAWKENASMPVSKDKITIHLSLYDIAKIEALAELFPGRTKEQIIGELLSAALNEIEESLPYVKGSRVIAEDEFGDPIYEDIGITPAFEAATHRHYKDLEQKNRT